MSGPKDMSDLDYTLVMSLMSAEAMEREQRHTSTTAFGDYAVAMKRCIAVFGDPCTTSDARAKAMAESNSAWQAYLRSSKHWREANIDAYHLKHGIPFTEELTDEERLRFQIPVLHPETPSGTR